MSGEYLIGDGYGFEERRGKGWKQREQEAEIRLVPGGTIEGGDQWPGDPDDLCSLEVLFNGKPERIGEISRRNIRVIEADPRYVIMGKPVVLGYGAAKDADCAKWGNE